MTQLILTLSIIIGSNLVVLLIWLIAHFRKNSLYSLKKANQNTTDFINENSNRFLLTYFCGVVRSGKTTLMAGFTNVLADGFADKVENILKNIPLIFYDVDFNKVDEIIESDFKQQIPPNITTNKLVKNDDFSSFKLKYDSGIELVPGSTLVRQYVDAKRAQLKDNFVYSYNGDFVREKTAQPSQEFFPEMIEIKNRLINKDYRISRYSIIAEDEKNAATGKRCTDFKKIASEDTGSALFMQLIGHLGHESIFYLTTSQEFERSLKEERALATSVVYIRRRQEIYVHRIKRFFIKTYAYFYEKHHAKKINSLEISIRKKRLFNLNQKLKYLRAQNYMKYYVTIYGSSRDVGRPAEQCSGAVEKVFTFRIKQVFGCFSRYGFESIQDVLEEKAVPQELLKKDQIVNSESFAEKILKKNEKKEKEVKQNGTTKKTRD